MKRFIWPFAFAAVLALGCIDAAYTATPDFPGLHIHKLNVQRHTNTGRMDVTWYGKYPLSYYENRWLPYDISTGNHDISFEIWVTTWVGTCKPPCRLQVEFITRNVKVITK